MNEGKRLRANYCTPRQKKKLVELVTRHPELIACKVTQDFNYKDSHKLWQDIASQCNSIPGARKTWRQWRKTWQDLRCRVRSKTKKGQTEINGELPSSVIMLTEAEQEALGLNNSAYQESTEFVPLDQDCLQDNIDNEIASTASISEPESPPEVKVFTQSQYKMSKMKNIPKHSRQHLDKCYFNCDMLAVHEQRKIQIKEDYLNFKKDYLRQKIKLMKEQTEALKTIAKELSESK